MRQSKVVPVAAAAAAWAIIAFWLLDLTPGISQPKMACGSPIYERNDAMVVHVLFDQMAKSAGIRWAVHPGDMAGNARLVVMRHNRAALSFNGSDGLTYGVEAAPLPEPEVICVARRMDRWERH